MRSMTAKSMDFLGEAVNSATGNRRKSRSFVIASTEAVAAARMAGSNLAISSSITSARNRKFPLFQR